MIMKMSSTETEIVTLDSLKPVIKQLYAETGVLTMNEYNKKPIVLSYTDETKDNVSTNLHKKYVRDKYTKRALYRRPGWNVTSIFLTTLENHVYVSGSYLATIKVGTRHLLHHEKLEKAYQYPEGYNILDHISTFYDGTTSLDLPNDFVGRIEFELHYKDKSKIIYRIDRAYPDTHRRMWSSGYVFPYETLFRGEATGKIVINFVDFQ